MRIGRLTRQLTRGFLALTLAVAAACCGGHGHTEFDRVGMADENDSRQKPAPWDLIDENGNSTAPTTTQPRAPRPSLHAPQSRAPRPALRAPQYPADSLRQALKIGRYGDVFNDSNKYQYAAAERIGITPISGVADAYFTRRPMVEVKNTSTYVLDSLTHSMPYLVPEAAKLLDDIGRHFAAALKKRGIPAHRLRVTSLLRSHHSVKRLRRVNRNAVDSSTHQLGTTFDISWARFEPNDPNHAVSDAILKKVLADVLFEFRVRNRCMVKFERKSPCFHISAI